METLSHGGKTMLVLSRCKEEKVNIGDDIVITVLRIGDFAVSLGFDAPKHVAIDRHEIYLQKQEKKRATQIEPNDGRDDHHAHGE